jgi:hypothetical protein
LFNTIGRKEDLNILDYLPCLEIYLGSPGYSGGRDQEDHGWKPAGTDGSPDPILKKLITKKRAGGVSQGGGPEFKLQYQQKEK